MKSKQKINVPALFADWYKQNESRFSIKLKRTPYKQGKDYTFEGISETISVFVDDGGIIVWAVYDGEYADMLYDIDAVAVHAAKKGYYCKLCSVPTFYPTVEEFYAEHCFEKLLLWINTKLAKAKSLEICFMDHRGGSSWAYLDNHFRKPLIFKKPYYYLRRLYSDKKDNVERIKIVLRNK